MRLAPNPTPTLGSAYFGDDKKSEIVVAESLDVPDTAHNNVDYLKNFLECGNERRMNWYFLTVLQFFVGF